MIPEHSPNKDCEYLKDGMCYHCCETCNIDRHTCHFCGAYLNHNSFDLNGERHYLSDCRPDLLAEHPDGPMA